MESSTSAGNLVKMLQSVYCIPSALFSQNRFKLSFDSCHTWQQKWACITEEPATAKSAIPKAALNILQPNKKSVHWGVQTGADWLQHPDSWGSNTLVMNQADDQRHELPSDDLIVIAASHYRTNSHKLRA